jgi:hypothetical protein
MGPISVCYRFGGPDGRGAPFARFRAESASYAALSAIHGAGWFVNCPCRFLGPWET